MEYEYTILSTGMLLLLLIVIINLFIGIRRLLIENSYRHIINVLKVAKIQFELFVKKQPMNQWQAKWIGPYECLINSGIALSEKCWNQNAYTVKDLNKYTGENRHHLKTKDEIEFANYINDNIPFSPLPFNSPRPLNLNVIEESLDNAITYANLFNNPFSYFLEEYRKASREMATSRLKNRATIGIVYQTDAERKPA